MSTTAASSTPGRKRDSTSSSANLIKYSAEDEALNQIAQEAESRLAAKRQARHEARKARIKELEKQQQEADDSEDASDGPPVSTSRSSTQHVAPSPLRRAAAAAAAPAPLQRRTSEVSDVGADSTDTIRDLRKEVLELKEKLNEVQNNNAQLDNEKSMLAYQVDTLKDEIEELEESSTCVTKELNDRTRELKFAVRDNEECMHQMNFLKQQIKVRDKLMDDFGLVMVGAGESLELVEKAELERGDKTRSVLYQMVGDGQVDEEAVEAAWARETDERRKKEEAADGEIFGPVALFSQDSYLFLQEYGPGNLDVRISKIEARMHELKNDLRRLKGDLDDEKLRNEAKIAEIIKRQQEASANGPLRDEKLDQLEKEKDKQISEFKFKLQKADNDIVTLQASVQRLEGQVKRYKKDAELAEEAENELKGEKRKLMRELREIRNENEELKASNAHYIKRLDKWRAMSQAGIVPAPGSQVGQGDKGHHNHS